MPKINSHPLRRAGAFAFQHSNLFTGCFVLRFPGKRVVVAPVPIVEKTTEREQKLQSRVERRTQCFWQQQLAIRPGVQLVHSRDQAQPTNYIGIPQPARTLFHVRLELEDGVAVLPMP